MFIKTFKQLNKKNVGIAGGKGASLGEMTRAGVPVPPGFVVLAEAFDRFLAETDLTQELASQLKKVNYDDIASVDKASAVIRDLILDRTMPEDLIDEIAGEFKKLGAEKVAVRSSATAEDSEVASWAGELESFMFVDEEGLPEYVKKCWSSLFTPRAIFYRKEKDLVDAHVSVAVVVQAMVDSEISGITFTVHPVTEDRDQMIIEAVWGQGEAIVSGSVTPDSYVINKKDWSLVDININSQEKQLAAKRGGGTEWKDVPPNKKNKQILSGQQIIELARLCQKLETHYKKPQDIEWAYAGGKFYITQSRPITTLGGTDYNFKEPEPKYERAWGGPKMPFLVSDIITDIYTSKLKFVTINTNDIWTCYIPIAEKEKALNEGFDIFSDSANYKKYRDKFIKFIESYDARFNKIIPHTNSIGAGEYKEFIKLSKQAETLYSYTQYFYTDRAVSDKFLESDFGDLKERGRALLNKQFMSNNNYFERILKKVSKTLKISIDSLLLYTWEEIYDMLNNKDVVRPNRKDRSIFITYLEGDKKITLTGKEAVEEIKNFESSHINSSSSELSGVVAHKGRAKGRVRVLDKGYEHKNIGKFVSAMKKNEILVSETTSPEIMPACKKAAAIVTNQGGLMSHAAIVSRELNIPCIVGTGNATLVLKDGDTVEVDAVKGIVKIIK